MKWSRERLFLLSARLVEEIFAQEGVVALGKDWRSRSLRRYEERYQAKPRRVV